MPYFLKRVVPDDSAGDSGQMSEALRFKAEGGYPEVISDRPLIGCCMRVGSHYARTFQHQDYWTTTPVTEIVEDRDDFVRFKTLNSEYEWRKD